MERYEAYKDSGIEWIGEIPKGWGLRRISALYDSRNEKVSDKDFPPLSVTMNGVVPQLETAAKSQDGDNRKLVKVGDFVINSRSDRRGSCGIAEQDGSVTLISNVLAPKSRQLMNDRYYSYLFKSEGFADEFYRQGTGIVDDLWSTNWSRMKNILVPFSSTEEQTAIADYLDTKTVSIDTLVADCRREVELLQEYRKAVISEAVTKGLDPNAPMKDSGIEWIGQIPAGWNALRLKFVAVNSVMPAGCDSGRYLGLEQVHSWTMSIAEASEDDVETSGIHYDENCVMFGKLRPYLAKVALPDSSGPCSSEFLVLYPAGVNRNYLAYTMVSELFVNEVNSLTYGVRMPRAGWDLVGNVPVPIPSVDEQRAIADYLDTKTAEIDSLIADKQAMVEKLQEFRKAFISE